MSSSIQNNPDLPLSPEDILGSNGYKERTKRRKEEEKEGEPNILID
jgi:hypothetical protein